MLIVRRSPFSGKLIRKELNVTPSQFDAWQRGVSLKKAFPDIGEDDQEFIKTGISGDEWDSIMLGDE